MTAVHRLRGGRGYAAALLVAALVALVATPAVAQLPPPRPLHESPWNGDWVVSRSRNPDETRQQAADGYRFHLRPDGSIRWEIPSLHEMVTGRTDGRPMAIHRPGASGATLAVRAIGPRTLIYTVGDKGRPTGEGRMTLGDGDTAWVDVSQPYGRPDLAGVVIYVRPDPQLR